MALSNITRSPVCSTSFHGLLVGGFGAQKEEVEEAAWGLAKILFNYSERQRHTHYREIESIVNNARYLTEVPSTDIDRILEFMTQSGECHEGITCAVFAHSHGAKVVAEALRDERFAGYLKKIHFSDEEVGKRINDIRRCLAVFAMGGIDRIPNTAAKVVVNTRLETDAKSFIGEKFFGSSEGASAEMHVIKEKEKNKVNADKVDAMANDLDSFYPTGSGTSATTAHCEKQATKVEPSSWSFPEIAKTLWSRCKDFTYRSPIAEALSAGSGTSTDMHAVKEEQQPCKVNTDEDYEKPATSRASDLESNSASTPLAPNKENATPELWNIPGIPTLGRHIKNIWLPPMKAVSTGHVKHVLGDYTFSDGIMQLIIDALLLGSDVQCGCHSQTNFTLAERQDTGEAAKI